MKQFIRFFSGLALICLFGAVGQLNGQVLLYDNFNYPAGEFLTDHNWLQQQTTATFPIAVGTENLSYSGYVGSGIGNSAVLGIEGQDVFRGFTKQTLPGNLYMSFMVKVTAATATGDYFIAFKESSTSTTNSNYRGRVWVKSDGGSNIAFGITKGAMTSPMVPNYSGTTYALNTTYLLVVKYIRLDGDPNDSVKLFINPVAGSPEPSSAAVINPDIDSGTDLTGLGSVLLRQGTNGSSPTVIVDGVRVSKSWQTALNVSDISTLSDLKVDGTTIYGFSPTIFNYNDTVPSGQTSVLLTSATSCAAATSTTNAATSIPGISTIQVTAETGTSTSTYTVTHAYEFFMISVSIAPASSGAVSGGGVVGGGLPTTLTASPNAGYIFENWTENGNIIGTTPVLTIPAVLGNHDIVCHFVASSNTFTVTAMPNPVDGGTITGSGNVTSGGNITLTATENPGFIFDNWTESGNVLGSNQSLTLTNVQANHSIVANFHYVDFINDQVKTGINVIAGTESISLRSSSVILDLCIYSMDGRVAYKARPNTNSVIVPSGTWMSGTYILKARASDRVFTQKVIIIK